MEAKDWTLLAIDAAGARQFQPVQLQKCLFLISRNLKSADLGTKRFYTFVPYDYGPFCADIYRDAERLEADGLTTIAKVPGARYNLYSITDAGSRKATECRADLTPVASDYLNRAVEFVTSHPFNELVRSIYAAYPEMRARSVFRG